MEELNLGFLSCPRFENDTVVRVGILVTNELTKPLEFRVTAPIRPTDFQRTLYGEIITEHILVELVAIPLFNTLGQKPELVIVRDPLFLGANDKQEIPVVRIFKEGEIRFAGNNKAEQVDSVGGKYEPILVETSTSIESKLSEFRRQLTEVFSVRNLLEPFDRITTALQQVHSQTPGE